MTTAALITKLKKKLEKETDQRVLQAIEIILEKGASKKHGRAVETGNAASSRAAGQRNSRKAKQSALSFTMEEAAKTSDRQFAEGKGLSLEEFRRRSDAFIHKLYAPMKKQRVAAARRAGLRRP